MKLIEALEILREDQPLAGETLVISLVCGFTPLHLETLLGAELRVLYSGVKIRIETGSYGDFLGNLQRLIGSRASIAIAILEWPDLDARLGLRSLGDWTPGALEDISSDTTAMISRIERTMEHLASEMPIVVGLPTLPLLPISFTPAWQISAWESELRACLNSFGARIARIPGIRVLSPQELDRLSPLGGRFDPKSELLAGFPYRLPHAAILAELLSRLAKNQPPKKGLITDLDDTLWKGIVGEAGPENVHWDLDQHSQMHGLYQRFLQALSAEGILIAVASKNEIGLVEQVFREREPVLPLDSIFPMEVHWGPKAESVSRILHTWNINADSVVFVDDSAAELAQVKAAHPTLECIQFPVDDYGATYDFLWKLRNLFGKDMLLEEDTIRMESIRERHRVNTDMAAYTGSVEAFLEQAQGELVFDYGKQTVDRRALELLAKTNQFNLNGNRFTESTWRRHLDTPESFSILVSYKDKYGPLGKIALLGGRLREDRLLLDVWVMSCRAFSRQIEHHCLEELFSKYGIRDIVFDFQQTARNKPLQNFLQEVLLVYPEPGGCLSTDAFRARGTWALHAKERINE
jgi:FkbH-like protein